MANAFNQFAEGYGQGQGMAQDFAQQRAGNALAQGDVAGAANTLYRSGQLQQGAVVQDRQTALHDKEVKDRLAWMSSAADALAQVPDDGTQQARKAAMQQHVLPTLQAMGLDPNTLQALSNADLSDQSLSMFKAQVSHQLQVVNRGNGGYDVVDLHNGQAVRSVPGRAEPKMIGDYLYLPDGQQPAAVMGQQATPATPSADAVWAAMKQRESGGNGNAVSPAGALGSTQLLPATAQQMAQKLGVAWRPDLIKGNSPEALAYQDKLGRAYFDEGLQKYGGDVTQAAMYYHGGPNQAIWGPKTRAYAQAVTQGQPLAGGAGQDTLSGAPQIPGYTLLGRAKAEKPAKPEDNTTVDPSVVKGLIEGRIMPPTQKAAATPYWQAQLQAATQQDPTFDGVNFQARAKTRADFTSGKSAQNITALNTVIGHLDHLDRTINELGNYGPGSRGLSLGPLNSLNNKAAQVLANASGTDARYKNFETAKTAVANELTRVFRGTGGAEADIQGWMKQLESTGSPEALHKVVQSMAELINSRIEALGEQYSQGMGTTKEPITLLTPDKQKAFQRLMGGQAQSAPSGGAAAPAGWSVKRVR